MKYSNVYIESIGYELAPVVVSSSELEDRLKDLYIHLKIPQGQIAALTGIEERRWWPKGFRLSDGAIAAGKKAIRETSVTPGNIETVIYTGVGREYFEPATACRVASELGIGGNVTVHDISNACLGMLSGMIDVANRIELGQIKAGLVVSSETAREIVEDTIQRMLENRTMDFFISSLATMTGGSGSAAVLLTDGSFPQKGECRRKLIGGAVRSAPEFHELCRWGMTEKSPRVFEEVMNTDAIGVLKNGVQLGMDTWHAFLDETGWNSGLIDKVVCHQVGATNRDKILQLINMPKEKDFPTFGFLGNMGTVSLPVTAAIAEQRGFLKAGDTAALLGIGSGLNCMMLGVKW